MTKFILIRHGKPDYSVLNDKGFIGHGNDLAGLSLEGKKQAEVVAKKETLKNSDILISSPYTRCMETASIIGRINNLSINVELDLHEWLPDLTYKYNHPKVLYNNYKMAKNDYINNIDVVRNYESIKNVKIRSIKVLKKYLDYDKVIVVTHGGVMYSLTGGKFNYCDIYELEKIKKLTKK